MFLPDKEPEFKQSGQIYIRITNVSGTTHGTYKLDKTTGWVSESKTTKHIAGTAEIKQTLDGQIVASYPISIDGNVDSTGK